MSPMVKQRECPAWAHLAQHPHSQLAQCWCLLSKLVPKLPGWHVKKSPAKLNSPFLLLQPSTSGQVLKAPLDSSTPVDVQIPADVSPLIRQHPLGLSPKAFYHLWVVHRCMVPVLWIAHIACSWLLMLWCSCMLSAKQNKLRTDAHHKHACLSAAASSGFPRTAQEATAAPCHQANLQLPTSAAVGSNGSTPSPCSAHHCPPHA